MAGSASARRFAGCRPWYHPREVAALRRNGASKCHLRLTAAPPPTPCWARIQEQDRARLRIYIGAAHEGLEPALIPERVMVCMSSNALAPRVLRTGARIAGRLGSRWYAVYVETPSERGDRDNPRDAEALQQNIKLAETLGATVVRVKADKPADGLIAFAQREGVTHVIFGQSARTRWELLVRGSTLDKFLSAVPDAAVQVVPLTQT